MMNSYENFIVNYRRYTHTPRTLDEAFKTADYAQAIWKCETENSKAVSMLISWGITIGLFAVAMLITIPTLNWLVNK